MIARRVGRAAVMVALLGLSAPATGARADGPVVPNVIQGGALDPSAIIRPGRSVGLLRLGMPRNQVERSVGGPHFGEPDAFTWLWGPDERDWLVSASFDTDRVYRIVTYVPGQRVLTTQGPRLGHGKATFVKGLRRVYRHVTGACGYGRCSYHLTRRTGAREHLILHLDDDGVRVIGAGFDTSSSAPR